MSDPRGGSDRRPLMIGAGLVMVAAIAVVAIAVDSAAKATPVARTTPTATPSPTPTSTPVPTPTPAPIAFASCGAVTFGPVLQPLAPPASVHVYAAMPATTIDATKLYQMTIATAKGDIVICLQPALAPATVNVFVTLARNHYFDGIPFHRVCPNTADSSCGGSLAIDQAGDPNCIASVSSSTCGQGGPGFQFADEPVHNHYVTGAVAMAKSSQPNSNGSQFFICTGDDTSLPPTYNIFGNVESGLAVAQAMKKGDVMTTVTVRAQA